MMMMQAQEEDEEEEEGAEEEAEEGEELETAFLLLPRPPGGSKSRPLRWICFWDPSRGLGTDNGGQSWKSHLWNHQATLGTISLQLALAQRSNCT